MKVSSISGYTAMTYGRAGGQVFGRLLTEPEGIESKGVLQLTPPSKVLKGKSGTCGAAVIARKKFSRFQSEALCRPRTIASSEIW